MTLQKLWLIAAITAPLLAPGYGLAADRTSIGYLSSVTSTSLVMDGMAHRFRPDHEEKHPIRVQCVAPDRKIADREIGCEELAWIDERHHAKAEVTFDSSGYVIRVKILDVLK